MKNILIVASVFVSTFSFSQSVHFSGTNEQKLDALSQITQEQSIQLKVELNQFIKDKYGDKAYLSMDQIKSARIEFFLEKKGIELTNQERKK